MTIGDTIWADAVLESGILRYMRTVDDAARLLPLALAVIRKINESHGTPETPAELVEKYLGTFIRHMIEAAPNSATGDNCRRAAELMIEAAVRPPACGTDPARSLPSPADR